MMEKSLLEIPQDNYLTPLDSRFDWSKNTSDGTQTVVGGGETVVGAPGKSPSNDSSPSMDTSNIRMPVRKRPRTKVEVRSSDGPVVTDNQSLAKNGHSGNVDSVNRPITDSSEAGHVSDVDAHDGSVVTNPVVEDSLTLDQGHQGWRKLSDDEYTSLLDRQSKGESLSEDDRRSIWYHTHPKPVPPSPPEYSEPYTPPPAPSPNDYVVTRNTDNAYKMMRERMLANGDDPETKGKRVRARRAAKIVSALGDLLQSSVNMLGAARGAKSAELSSMSASLRKGIAEDVKQELSRGEKYEKMLETARKSDDSESQAFYRRAMEEWRELNKSGLAAAKALKEGKDDEFKVRFETYKSDMRAWNKSLETFESGLKKEREQANSYKYQNQLAKNRNAYGMSRDAARTAGNLRSKKEFRDYEIAHPKPSSGGMYYSPK